MATWAPKTYPTKHSQAEPRMTCPAYPRPGAPWEWCRLSRGRLAACADCEWGKDAGADIAKCVQS